MAQAAAVIGLVVAIVGAGSSIYQGMQAADAREEEKDRMEGMAKRDAEVLMEESKKLTAKQRALFAASGVKVGEGSPLAVIAKSQADAEEERQEILNLYGFRSKSLTIDADRIRTSSYMTGAGTLLSGVSNYASSPYASNPFATTSPTYTPTYPQSGPTHHSR